MTDATATVPTTSATRLPHVGSNASARPEIFPVRLGDGCTAFWSGEIGRQQEQKKSAPECGNQQRQHPAGAGSRRRWQGIDSNRTQVGVTTQLRHTSMRT